MCDYSLHAVASRPARVGDELVTTEFAGSTTRGFAADGEPHGAICLLPGTELAFAAEAERDHPFAPLQPGFGFGKLGGRIARFRKINPQCAQTHHDALELDNGNIVLVTRLRLGQRARVLQLPAQRAGRRASQQAAADEVA